MNAMALFMPTLSVSWEVQQALVDFVKSEPQKLALYPDPDSNELHEKIADMLNKTGGVLCRAHVNGDEVTPDPQDKIPFTEVLK